MQLRNLRNILAPRERAELQKTVGVLGLDYDRNLIPNIASYLFDYTGVSTTLESLKPKPRSLLRDILLLTPGSDFQPNVERLRRAPGFKPLYERGLLGIGKGFMGGTTLLVAEESYPMMLDVLYHWEAKGLAETAVESVDSPHANAGAFLRNITTLIALAEAKGLALTRNGEIAKGFLKKNILPYMELIEAADDPGGRYPVSFSDVLDFCNHFDFLLFEEGIARPTERAYAFLDATAEDIIFALRHFAASRLTDVDAVRIVDLLSALPNQSEWIPVGPAIDSITSGIYATKYRVRVKKLWQEAVALLDRLGIIESGIGARDARYMRLGHLLRGSGSDSKSESIIITPDFKISAPRNLDFRIRHELFHYCRFIRADQMDQWEITRDSIDRAIDEGRDAASICEFLARHSSTPVPGNVADSIRLWAEEHASLRFYHTPVLIVDDDRERKLVRALCSELNAAVEMPSDNVIILADAKAELVLERIRARRKINVLRLVTRKSSRSLREHVEEVLARKAQAGPSAS